MYMFFLRMHFVFSFKPGAKRVSEYFRYGMNSAGREDKKIKNAQVNSTAVNKFGTKKDVGIGILQWVLIMQIS